MGQVLRQDKIGQLTHSAGNIIMAASVANPAYLTIGGRQYTVTNNLSVALPSMAANTRYQVFAVQSGGVVSLVISLNENSVGPAGFLSWKLVGSLYSNGLSPVTFGAFINIKGIPETPFINGGENLITTTAAPTTPLTKGARALDQFMWKRIGDTLQGQINFNQTGAGAAGSGDYLWNLPLNLPAIDFTKTPTNSDLNNLASDLPPCLGAAMAAQAAVEDGHGYVTTWTANNAIRLIMDTSASPGRTAVGSTWWALNIASRRFGADFRIPLTIWTNTPIEDL